MNEKSAFASICLVLLCSATSFVTRGNVRVARCLTENMASVCLIYGKLLAKIFENSNIFGNMDFSLRNGNFLAILISFHIFFHSFKFFKFDN